MDDHRLMELRADTVFTYDARRRMVYDNDPEERPAPHLFLGRAQGGYVLRFGTALADDTVRRLEDIVHAQPAGDGVHIPAAMQTALRDELAAHLPVARQEGGPAYRFPEPVGAPSQAIQITEANRDFLRETYRSLYQELALWWPCFAVVENGAAVATCCSARLGAAVAEAGVHTLPAFRGRGYAAAVTAAWAAAVRRSGRIPLYSTSWDNLASQGVARHLGLVMFGTDASWR